MDNTHRIRPFPVAIACGIFSYFVLFLLVYTILSAEDAGSRPYFWFDDVDSFTYTELLDRHDEPDTDPVLLILGALFAVLQVVTLGLIVYAARGRALLVHVFACLGFPALTVLVCLFVIALLVALAFSLSGTYLHHRQTVTLGDHVYHLTAAHDRGGELDINDDWDLYLFECDATGEDCQVLHSWPDNDGIRWDNEPEAAMTADDNAGDLHVYVDGKLVYTVSSASDSG